MSDERPTSRISSLAASVGYGLLVSWAVLAVTPSRAEAATLRPSRASLDRQNRQARVHDFTFIRDESQLRYFVKRGWLTRVRGTAYSTLHGVSFPYARPEVRTFIDRLSRQYYRACGEKLVVTSLTRPKTRQPWNASRRSVHPTGMALDIRRSRARSCRRWVEETLLFLERKGLLEATYERSPPHYHLAVFPDPYRRYVERMQSGKYRVVRGDSLWKIARRFRTSPATLKRLNDISSDRIYAGQTLHVPSGR